MHKIVKTVMAVAGPSAFLFAFPGSGSAETHINLLYTAANNYIAAYVAQDQGYFLEHGLDVDLSLGQNAGVILPAVLSGSAQIGATPVITPLQAIDQGLDFVIIAGTNVYIENAPVQGGIVARAGSGTKNPQDLIGKKIGQSGFGGVLDVLTRRWVKLHGVDPAQMQWVEIPFPRMNDALKAGMVDVVTAVDPFYTRIIADQVGERIGDFSSIIQPGASLSVYVTTRGWAQENAATVRAFRDALDEAVTYMGKAENKPSVLDSTAKWTKLPPQAAATLVIPDGQEVHAKPSSLTFWIEVSKDQGLIKGNPDPSSLIAP